MVGGGAIRCSNPLGFFAGSRTVELSFVLASIALLLSCAPSIH